MSGHNKWSSIKHKKAAVDAKRGKLFSKLIKEITVAARLGGGDEESNPRLRTAVMKAKDNNMPNSNIDRAIKKGTGELEGESYEEVTYEGYGPYGVAFLIHGLTDNKNRSVSEIRNILSKNDGNMGENGSVAWQFERKGIINIEKDKVESEDKLMELMLEAGCEDIETEEEGYTIKTDPKDFVTVVDILKKNNIQYLNADIMDVPQNTVEVSGEQADKVSNLINLLEDSDDVQSVSTNADFK